MKPLDRKLNHISLPIVQKRPILELSKYTSIPRPPPCNWPPAPTVGVIPPLKLNSPALNNSLYNFPNLIPAY